MLQLQFMIEKWWPDVLTLSTTFYDLVVGSKMIQKELKRLIEEIEIQNETEKISKFEIY